jgi:hypothetical protein
MEMNQKQKVLQECQEALSILQRDIHQHVESTTPLRYLDAIKDALSTHNTLERRLDKVLRQLNENPDQQNKSCTKADIQSISLEIHVLARIVKSIAQADKLKNTVKPYSN